MIGNSEITLYCNTIWFYGHYNYDIAMYQSHKKGYNILSYHYGFSRACRICGPCRGRPFPYPIQHHPSSSSFLPWSPCCAEIRN